MKLSLFLLALIGIGCLALATAQLKQSKDAGAQAIRRGFKLPKLLDFERFKQLFKKHYNSLIEELARKRLFLARAFEVFVSAVCYKHRKTRSYLAVNQMSDWTPTELELTHVKNIGADSHETQLVNDKTAHEPLPVADLQEIDQKLAQIVKDPNAEPGYKEMVDELKAQMTRKRRDTSSEGNMREFSLDDLIRAPKRIGERFEEIESNNPEYVEPELTSEGGEENAPFRYEDLGELFVKGAGYLVFVLNDAVSRFLSPGDASDHEEPDDASDIVWVNHGEGGCFLAVRDQGRCASCYAFAAIALYEWFFCNRTGGKQVAFSEQYVVDCGNARFGHDLEGCDGGNFVAMNKFVNEYGLELRSHYPYREKTDTCPYQNNTPASTMGYMRVQDEGYIPVHMNDIREALKINPMMVDIRTDESFCYYGGGVSTLENCRKDWLHSVLIVGEGREEGQEYWIIRNSYGNPWGLGGYMKLDKAALERCNARGFVFAINNFKINSTRVDTSTEVKDRYLEYVEANVKGVEIGGKKVDAKGEANRLS